MTTDIYQTDIITWSGEDNRQGTCAIGGFVIRLETPQTHQSYYTLIFTANDSAIASGVIDPQICECQGSTSVLATSIGHDNMEVWANLHARMLAIGFVMAKLQLVGADYAGGVQ